MLMDEDAVLAQRASAQGVPVTWECYEAMPHCFTMILDGLGASRKCYENWAAFVSGCVERSERVRRTRGVFVEAKTLRERVVDVGELGGWMFEEVLGRMREARAKRMKGEEGEGKALPKL